MPALPRDEREVGEDVLRVQEQFAAHPRGGGHDGDGDRDELHREAERLLLDLRERLQLRDEHADYRRDGDGRREMANGIYRALVEMNAPDDVMALFEKTFGGKTT